MPFGYRPVALGVVDVDMFSILSSCPKIHTDIRLFLQHVVRERQSSWLRLGWYVRQTGGLHFQVHVGSRGAAQSIFDTNERKIALLLSSRLRQVYGYMDLYRRKAKRLKQLALQKSRNARVAWRREQLAIGRGSYQSRASTAPSPNTATSTLRRYSSLNLAAAGAAAAGAATSDGLVRLGAGKK